MLLNRKTGEIIKAMTGFYGRLTGQEKMDLITPKNDFSIKIKGANSYVYLGPAAFVNHSCVPNCAEVLDSRPNCAYHQPSRTYLKVIRPIGVGEELTCSYGKSYFDEDSPCVCQHCKPELW